MSSSDLGRTLRRVAVLAVLGGAAALGGCTIQPVYAPQASGQSVATDLSMISIQSVDGRVPQEVRNNLVFAFAGGGNPSPTPRYDLALQVATSEMRLGFERNDNSPAYSVTVIVNYQLKETGTDRVLLRTIGRGVASYDRSNQQFANERARIDAENRAAAAAADEIRLRIATALVRGAGA